jgi:hypothetical protein
VDEDFGFFFSLSGYLSSHKSVNPSYSLTANIQRVWSMLKNHNPNLCSLCADKRPLRSKNEADRVADRYRVAKGRGWHSNTGQDGDGVEQVLSLLENEYQDLTL